MAVRQQVSLLERVVPLIWALIVAQALLVCPSIVVQEYGYWKYRHDWSMLQARPHKTPVNSDLKVGLKVGPLKVRSDKGTLIDLSQQTVARQAVLFVSDCAPCAAPLLAEYEKLWREGLAVRVVAAARSARIREARQLYGLTLPIYSDFGLPQATRNCRVVYRPAAMVMNRQGRVIYAQGTSEDRTLAISKVALWLRQGGSDPRSTRTALHKANAG